MQHDAEKSSARFGGHWFDPARQALIGPDGAEVALRHKSLQVFRYLAAHADHALNKEQIIDAVWSEVAVTDDSLVQCIADIRRALGEDGFRVLKTVPRVGYMLIADRPVAERGQALPATSIEVRESGEQTEARFWHRAMANTRGMSTLVAAALLLTTGLVAYNLFGEPADSTATNRSTLSPATAQVIGEAAASESVAALSIGLSTRPSGDDEANTALQAVERETTAALSRYRTVRLVKTSESDLRLILGVNPGHGSEKHRVIAEVVDTGTGEIFFARSFALPAQPDAAHKIGVSIAAFASPGGGALAQHLMQTARGKPVEQLSRAECYAHGYDCTSCSGRLETITRRALACLQNILDKDPQDTRALALKSTVHTQQYRWGNALREPERSDLQAREHHIDDAVRAAVAAEETSDGADSSVYWAMAQAYSARCDIEKMRGAIRKGLKINPDDPALLAAFGNWLAFSGQWDEGAALARRAIEIQSNDYKDWWMYAIGKRDFAAGRHEAALKTFMQAFSENNWVTHLMRAYTFPYLGRLDEAKEAVRQVLLLNPGYTVEKALQFYRVYCFDDAYLSKIKRSLTLAGLPSIGDSSNLGRIRTPEVKVLSVNGAPFEYLDIGEGEPIVFVHGAVGDYRAWGLFEAPISAKHRFISYSQRFYGSQVWTDDPAKVSLEQYVDDLVRFIEALDVGPVHLVTWSFGGKVGIPMAVARPDLLKSALHFEPVIPEVGSGPDIDAAREQFFASLGATFDALQRGDTIATAKRFIEAVFEQPIGAFEKENIGFQRMVTENTDTLAVQFLSPDSPLQAPMLTCDYLLRTQTPTLIAYGEKSNDWFRLLFEKKLGCIPGSKRAVMQGLRHDAPLRKPDEFVRLVDQWVDRNAAQTVAALSR